MEIEVPIRAGFWRRAAALLVDIGLLTPIVILVGYTFARAYLATFPNANLEPVGMVGSAAGMITAWLYSAMLESSAQGGTYGKRLLGLRVVGKDGTPPGFARAGARALAKLFSALLLMVGFLLAAGREHRALHDRLTGTLVLRG